MKLLLVDLDSLLFPGSQHRAIGLPAPQVQAQANQDDPEANCARWRTVDSRPACVVVLVGNQSTMANGRWRQKAWGRSLRRDAADLAKQVWPDLQAAAIAAELAMVFTAPEASDEALLALLQHSPWEHDDNCEVVGLVSDDGNLRQQVENLLPRTCGKRTVGANLQLWTPTTVRHKRRGTGDPPVECKRNDTPIGWSQVLRPLGAKAGLCDLDATVLESLDRLQVAVGRRAHLKSQISVNANSVAGVRRLAEMMTAAEGGLPIPLRLQWHGASDYLEICTRGTPLPANGADASPAARSALGLGAVRFEGQAASVCSRLPAELWRHFVVSNPDSPALKPMPKGLVANDFGMANWHGAVATPQPVQLEFVIASRPGREGRRELVCYPPVGWWWARIGTSGVSCAPQLRTNVAAGRDAGSIGQQVAAVPCFSGHELYYRAPIYAANAHVRMPQRLAAGQFSVVNVVGLRDKHVDVWILAETDLHRASSVVLKAVQEFSVQDLQSLYPQMSAEVAENLRRLPLALAREN
jgi:hypothetical protein